MYQGHLSLIQALVAFVTAQMVANSFVCYLVLPIGIAITTVAA